MIQWPAALCRIGCGRRFRGYARLSAAPQNAKTLSEKPVSPIESAKVEMCPSGQPDNRHQAYRNASFKEWRLSMAGVNVKSEIMPPQESASLHRPGGRVAQLHARTRWKSCCSTTSRFCRWRRQEHDEFAQDSAQRGRRGCLPRKTSWRRCWMLHPELREKFFEAVRSLRPESAPIAYQKIIYDYLNDNYVTQQRAGNENYGRREPAGAAHR